MRIEHVAIWTYELEVMRQFYSQYFQMKPGKKYVNAEKEFASYFLESESGCRLELMTMKKIPPKSAFSTLPKLGLAHLAISVGSEEVVNELTEKLRQGGFRIVGEPRWTGDGYYESCVLDPEENRIEITI